MPQNLQISEMEYLICRTCFKTIKTRKYISLKELSRLREYETVEEALKKLVPSMNLKLVANAVMCTSCWYLIKSAREFKNMCMENEKKLLEHQRKTKRDTVSLGEVVNATELVNIEVETRMPIVIINDEHDYAAKELATSKNLPGKEKLHNLNSEDLEAEDGSKTKFQIIDNSNENPNSFIWIKDAQLEEVDCKSVFVFKEDEPQVLESDVISNTIASDPLLSDTRMQNMSDGEDLKKENDSAAKENKDGVIEKMSCEEDLALPSQEVDGELKDSPKVNAEAPAESRDCKPQQTKTSEDALVKSNDKGVIFLTCTRCLEVCDGYKSAGLHAQNKHNVNRIICCKLCCEIFYTSRTYQMHNRIHGYDMDDERCKPPKAPKPPKVETAPGSFFMLCDLCGLIFRSRLIYARHEQRHRNGTHLQCKTCGRPAYTASQLKKHELRHLRQKAKVSHGSRTKDYLCQYCGKRYSQYASFRQHRLQHKVEGRFECSECGKVFSRRVSLNFHKRVHNKEKRYLCDICGMQFKYPEGFRQHKKRHSDTPVGKNVACPLCEHKFTSTSRMRLHLASHYDIRPYVCELCGRGFGLSANLKRHMLTHTGEKPYECERCGKRFTQRSSVKLHQQASCAFQESGETMKKKEPKVEVFKCDLCDRTFKYRHCLTMHMKAHANGRVGVSGSRKCKECGREFANTANLRRHMLVHTGEKPYSCNLCDRSFRQKQELIVHLRRHNGHKPYVCDVCGKCFVDYSEQSRHHKRHLKEVTRVVRSKVIYVD